VLCCRGAEHQALVDEICMHSAATGKVIGFDGRVLQVATYTVPAPANYLCYVCSRDRISCLTSVKLGHWLLGRCYCLGARCWCLGRIKLQVSSCALGFALSAVQFVRVCNRHNHRISTLQYYTLSSYALLMLYCVHCRCSRLTLQLLGWASSNSSSSSTPRAAAPTAA
jgi:hypothetical protein